MIVDNNRWSPFGRGTTMAERYFALVSNEMDCLPEADGADAHKRELWEKAKEKKLHIEHLVKQHCRLELTEVFGLEMLVLRLLPAERLLSRAWSIRDAYRKLVPDEMYRKYEESKPPELLRDPKDRIETELKNAGKIGDSLLAMVEARYLSYLTNVRADAEDILSATHWWYTNSNYREERIQCVKRKLVYLLIALLILVCLLSLNTAVMQSTMLVTVALMGMMGAIFSISRRILPVSTQDVTQCDPVIRATQFDHGGTGIYLSIWVGGISAVVLYLLMGAGLSRIDINIFPQSCGLAELNSALNCKADNDKGISLATFFLSLMPANTVDYAKLLCWSFLAGFAEQFVPDILDRMTKSGKGSGK